MGGRSTLQADVARYSYDRVVHNVLQGLKRRNKEPKDVYVSVRIPKDGWSRKTTPQTANKGKKSTFKLEELSRIAEYLDAPDGWPFVEWDLAAANKDALEALRDKREHEPPIKVSTSAQTRRRKKIGAP